ncbi:DUF402 domain-containing protein [Spiroplasma tabanidicola]|uniref:DUF402 domain-containing protein n=1 Tax=Spiroplasma tabanidicola TaxID=324079 RepID=A0A6I6C9Q6_9MOLU|nr:DUF402 domain-containing protein [Spiroplasma tabanidicola]QGS51631.1 hypothetical protein STABA_v1c02650 [Spiroplasma tabanidicola]
MENVKPGDKLLVHAYKHNGNLYRSWDSGIVLESSEKHLILINQEVLITEVTGRKWKTNEPAIWFFFKDYWFNVICMFKDSGINYYCNLASPFIVESETIKYIDYDLDIKVFNDGSYKILDLKEFNRNRISLKYTRNIIETVWESIDKLKKMIKEKKDFFDHDYVTKLWEWYLQSGFAK